MCLALSAFAFGSKTRVSPATRFEAVDPPTIMRANARDARNDILIEVTLQEASHKQRLTNIKDDRW
jgi:hypothetical protein